MQAIGIRKRWQAVNSDVYSRRPLVLRWAVAPWLGRAAVSRLGKRRESQSIYRLERWHASLPPCWPRVAHLTAVWVPLALAALGQVFRDCQWCCNIKAIFFRSASMKGGWIIPAGSFLLKIMHIYECSSMILGAITECFIPEGFFFPFGSEWSQLSFHYFAHLSSHHFSTQTAFLRAGILAQKGPNISFSYHLTTFSQVLKQLLH